jgi:hypothetical protein
LGPVENERKRCVRDELEGERLVDARSHHVAERLDARGLGTDRMVSGRAR